jgi:heat shock protein HslJ
MTRLPPRGLALPFAAVLILSIVAGCDDAGGSSGPGGGRAPTALAGAAWVVASVSGQAPSSGGEPTVAFTATTVSGSAGCNQYSGRYQYDPPTGRLAIGDIAMTAMACLDNRRNAFETRFGNALRQVDHAEVDAAGRLVLGGPGGVIVLTNGRIPVEG